jgi:processive 1,2-diacylglycerol beta-glucosyltransferase
LIVNPIPGQEERNSDHLLEVGAALRCNNLSTLPWKIENLLAEPVRMTRLRERARAAARPRASFDIVHRMTALLQTTPPEGLPPLPVPEAEPGKGPARRRRRALGR